MNDATGGAPARVAWLGLGSNLGDRAAHLAFALRELRAHGRVTGVASVYESDPVGFTDQPRFLNTVARLETDRSPRALLDAILDIERRRGRTRDFPNAPRTLDIDILCVGERSSGPGQVIREPGLRLPHPRIAERPFVLVPLLELAPEMVDPESGRRYAEQLAELAARQGLDADDTIMGPDTTAPREPGKGLLPDPTLDALGLRRVMDGRELLEGADDETAERDGDHA